MRIVGHAPRDGCAQTEALLENSRFAFRSPRDRLSDSSRLNGGDSCKRQERRMGQRARGIQRFCGCAVWGTCARTEQTLLLASFDVGSRRESIGSQRAELVGDGTFTARK